MHMSHITASPERRIIPSAIAELDKPELTKLQLHESTRVSLQAFEALNNSLLPDTKGDDEVEQPGVLEGTSSNKHHKSCNVDEETYYAQQLKSMRLDLDCLN